jgi:hypothetical protein
MVFKKFIQFITEKKKGNSKDIEEVSADKPNIDPTISLACPKCGNSDKVCNCYTDDYYNAKTPQNTPKGQIKTKKKKDE